MEVLAETESQVLQALNKFELLIENNDFICEKQYSIAGVLLTPMLDYLFFLPVKDRIFQSVPKLNNYIQRMQQIVHSLGILK